VQRELDRRLQDQPVRRIGQPEADRRRPLDVVSQVQRDAGEEEMPLGLEWIDLFERSQPGEVLGGERDSPTENKVEAGPRLDLPLLFSSSTHRTLEGDVRRQPQVTRTPPYRRGELDGGPML